MSGSDSKTPYSRFVDKIGRCGACMRQSFAVAALAWVAVAAAQWFQSLEAASRTALIVAMALSLLWLLHGVTYMVRALRRDRHSVDAPELTNSSTRRHALTVLGRSAAAAFIVSTPLVLWSPRAQAFCGQCTVQSDCGTCRCVNTAPVNSGKICNECVCP
jgi:hypothetical protein